MGRVTELIFWVAVKNRNQQKKLLNNLRLNVDRQTDRPITRIIVTYWSAYRVFVLPTYAC
jgi:hypothetical protein